MSETVLITGASSGIGLEFAKLFAASNRDLILVARSEAKLNELRKTLVEGHGVHVEVIIADLAKVDAAKNLAAEIMARKLIVNILVNNAGFGELGRFAEIPVERQIDMLRLNVVTLTHLTRLLIPEMIKRDSGGVLNVASTAAFQPGPYMAVYYATKAYVLSLSEAMHEELSATNVKVTCLAPGPTKTGFGEESGMNKVDFFNSNAMDSVKVAQAGFDAFERNKAIVVPGFKNQIGAFLTRLVPRLVVRKAVAKMQH